MKKLMQLLRDNAAAERKPLICAKKTQDKSATLYVYDVIDSYWGVSAQQVAQALSQLEAGTTVHVRINSPGGDVFEARAIKTLLDQFDGTVVTHVDALAASAATTIALAGDRCVIAEGAYFMIHNAWSVAIGDKAAMTDMAALLEKMDGTIAADYSKKTGKAADEVAALMNSETWMTAQEALDAGFVDELVGGAEDDADAPKNTFNLAAFDKVPKALVEPAPPARDLSAVHANNARRLRLLQIA